LLTYQSEPNQQVIKVIFNPDVNFVNIVPPQTEDEVVGKFTPSEFSENDFKLFMLSIHDFDGGSLDIYREELVAAEFDVLLTDSYGFFSYLLNETYGAVKISGATIAGAITTSMWYRFDTTQTLGTRNYLMSIGYGNNSGDAELYIDNAGQLFVAVKKIAGFETQLVNGVNLIDGNWHSVILSYSAITNEVAVYIDGVYEQLISSLDEITVDNVYISNPTANEAVPQAYGCRGYIANAEVWSTWFDYNNGAPKAVEYHNNGAVINPRLHSLSPFLLNDWTFGDNANDDGINVQDTEGNYDLTILSSQSTEALFRSANTEPTWPTNDGDVVNDYEIEWTAFTADATTPSPWNANTYYDIGSIVQPTIANGFYYIASRNNRVLQVSP
jgi:hypothetical protein